MRRKASPPLQGRVSRKVGFGRPWQVLEGVVVVGIRVYRIGSLRDYSLFLDTNLHQTKYEHYHESVGDELLRGF
jgi:hypothetical protein